MVLSTIFRARTTIATIILARNLAINVSANRENRTSDNHIYRNLLYVHLVIFLIQHSLVQKRLPTWNTTIDVSHAKKVV